MRNMNIEMKKLGNHTICGDDMTKDNGTGSYLSDWTISNPEAEMQSLEKLIRMAKSKEGAQSGII